MSGTREAATDANPCMDAAAAQDQGAFADAAGHAYQWVQKYPLHALAVAFAKGVLLGLYLRR